MHGFVEAVMLGDFFDQRRVEAATAAAGASGGRGHFTATTAHCSAAKALQTGDGLIHRATGGGLHDQKVDHQNAQQGGDDE